MQDAGPQSRVGISLVSRSGFAARRGSLEGWRDIAWARARTGWRWLTGLAVADGLRADAAETRRFHTGSG